MPIKTLKAILWDGQKRLKGQLHLEKHRMRFQTLNFANTDLDLEIAYADIREVNYYQLYDLTTQGLEILTGNDKCNVFIIEEPVVMKKTIEKNIIQNN